MPGPLGLRHAQKGENNMSSMEIAKTGDIPAGQMKSFVVEGKEILVFNNGGNFYAIGRYCTHLHGDLSRGKLEGTTITCPRHGAQFDITTGRCLAGPKIGPLKLNTKDEATYAMEVEGQSLRIVT
jgi:3-phenylpropionate/trans-cinnamate dioxygenase ferredoxin subunit